GTKGARGATPRTGTPAPPFAAPPPQRRARRQVPRSEQPRRPIDEWQLRAPDTTIYTPQSELVAEGAPSFLSPPVAVASLLGIASGSGNIDRRYVVRRQDLRCRIEGVRIRTAELVVVVQGQLAGVTVELAGEQPGP